MQKASNWKSGLDMERWLTPWKTSTHKRPFTQEGNYLVDIGLSLLLNGYCDLQIWLFSISDVYINFELFQRSLAKQVVFTYLEISFSLIVVLLII